MTSAAASYPHEPFAQAENLLSGLIDSYRGSTDAADMADIQSMVETTVRIAQDREFRVHNNIKGMGAATRAFRAPSGLNLNACLVH